MSDELTSLPHSHTPRLDAWRLRVTRRFSGKVRIVLTRNRRSMVSIRRLAGGKVELRLQMGFEDAPDSILEDLEEVIDLNRSAAWKRVCAHARTMSVEKYIPSPTRNIRPHTKGRCFDLQDILDEVNAEFFRAELEARITWSSLKPARKGRRRSRSLQFGVWDETRRLIRVHPGLDDPSVPRAFMRYLVYHELCHAAAPPKAGENGLRRIHHPQFRELEHRFPKWQEMEKLGKVLFERITSERQIPTRSTKR